MRVHHLNGGTMNVPTAQLVCHVLLIETENGLVLVDTGFGILDCARPRLRLGPARFFIKPILSEEETVVARLDALGLSRDDVRYIVVTHFDLDHIDGIDDFPHAEIHVTAAEVNGAIRAPSRREGTRYRAAQWAHDPAIVEHSSEGEMWRGFAAAKELDGISPGIVLVSLPGHTRGHACVAVDAGHRWVLHAGDSSYHYGTLDGRTHVPLVLTAQENLVAFDRQQVRDNHARLAELFHRGDPELLIVNSHDPDLFRHAHQTGRLNQTPLTVIQEQVVE